MILKCRGKAKHLDYFDSCASKTMHRQYLEQISVPRLFVENTNKHGNLKYENTSRKIRSHDLNANNSIPRDFDVDESKKAISFLFKAIKMGDISYISDYFGVAVLKQSSNDTDGLNNKDNNCRTSVWYIKESPSNKIIDDFVLVTEDELVKHKGKSLMRNVDIFGPEGLTPLHAASRVGSIDIVQYLLSVGASPQLRYVIYALINIFKQVHLLH